MEPLTLLGARIRTLRKRRGLTQAELAARVGRSVEALSVLERGRSTPTLTVLGRLAEALQVPLRDFFDPAGDAGGAVQSPEEAALFTELTDCARALPPAALEMTVRLVAVVAGYVGAGDTQTGHTQAGPMQAGQLQIGQDGGRPARTRDDDGAGNGGQDENGDWVGETLAALLRLYSKDRQAITAMLTRRQKFLLEMGDEDDAAFLNAVLKRLWQR